MPLYFAYGANMDVAEMRLRCPASRPLGTGFLRGFGFFVAACGYGSVRRKDRSAAHGLVWALSVKDVPALDRYEAVWAALYRKRIAPVRFGGQVRSALIYVARSLHDGAPAPGYMEQVLQAATRLRLPGAYLHELQNWIPGGVDSSL